MKDFVAIDFETANFERHSFEKVSFGGILAKKILGIEKELKNFAVKDLRVRMYILE